MDSEHIVNQKIVSDSLKNSFPCRDSQINTLCCLIRELNYDQEKSAFKYPCILVHGNQSTGKLSVVEKYLELSDHINYVIANCTTLYTQKLLVEHILNSLYGSFFESRRSDLVHLERCDNFVTLVCDLKKVASQCFNVVIVLKNCEKLDRESLNTLCRLQEYTSCSNITTVLITKTSPCNLQLDQIVPKIYFPQYTKDQLMDILLLQKPESDPEEFFKNFLNAFVGSLFNVCRDVREMKNLMSNVYPKYVEPVTKGELTHSDVVPLWRHISPYLRSAINNAYLGFVTGSTNEDITATQSLRMKLLDLPYYTKYFLISAYLASFINAKHDRKLFVKQSAGKIKRRNIMKVKNEKIENELLGARNFTLDRLLAIFYAIIEESNVNLTANLLVQVSSLVELKLLTALSDGNLDKPSYKCNVDKETIYAISKTVDFNIKKYLNVE